MPAVGAVRRPPITSGVWSSPPGNVGIQFVFFKQKLGVADANSEHLLKKNCLKFELRHRCSPVAHHGLQLPAIKTSIAPELIDVRHVNFPHGTCKALGER